VHPVPSSTDLDRGLVVAATSMASRVTVRAHGRESSQSAEEDRAALESALAVMHHVDRTCTRFDATSDLMRANARGGEWVAVDRTCFDAVAEAYAAYRRTGGRFDPRVLDDLVRLGYDVSYSRRPPSASDPGVALARRGPRPEWHPGLRPATHEVRIGSHPVDLGGIGKGLAVRWAADTLQREGFSSYLIDAGGDCYCAGVPADAPGWRISVEDPHGGVEPVAVLQLRDEAVATSSTRVRTWRVGDREVHHLVDPATGLPGGEGLASVTVVDADPARAEVWSKTLFLAGAQAIPATAELLHLPALWVTTDAAVRWSAAMSDRLVWTAPT
jgi:FAD:protein FMN transferase